VPVIFLPVYKISSLKITPPKTPNSGQFSYLLQNIVSFLFEKKSTRVPVYDRVLWVKILHITTIRRLLSNRKLDNKHSIDFGKISILPS
jgi:hypothetical protein